MNFMKLVLAALIGAFVVMSLLDGLVHMKLMQDFYISHMTAPCNIRRKDPLMLYIILGELLIAFIMAYLYPKGVESSNKLMEGLKFGAIIGILCMVPIDLILYGIDNISSRMVILADAGAAVVSQGIGGIVIAYVYGNSITPKAKQA